MPVLWGDIVPKLKASGSWDMRQLKKAFDMVQELYGEKEHWTGESLMQHVVGVLRVYRHFSPSTDAMVACLLHHTMEQQVWSLAYIEEQFGKETRDIVSSMNLLSHVTSSRTNRHRLQQLRQMFLRFSGDPQVLLLVLSNHRYLLSKIQKMPLETQRRMARDALDVFAPLAAKLGVYSMKHQLEIAAFPVAYQTDAEHIALQLSRLHAEHGDVLRAAERGLAKALKQHHIHARVEGREKSPYSIFQKMQDKSISSIEDLYDLYALRVIVKSEEECYQALGVVHRIGHPVPNRFKDYIAFPKPNGYKSVHTTLSHVPGMPPGMLSEIQIRTEDMHREADYGVAAHWHYKARKKGSVVRPLHPLAVETQSEETMLSDRIFVLTPKGDVVELPEGATPLDFAFHVHTAVGLAFKAAKVNGNIAPLTHRLNNGDVVEIVRHAQAQPSAHWINHLKSAAARSRLKQYFIAQQRPNFLALGKAALNEELKKHHHALLDTELTFLRLYGGHPNTFSEREEILVNIGRGLLKAHKVVQLLTAEPASPARVSRKEGTTLQAVVLGGIPMPVRFAKCCKPDSGGYPKLRGVIGRLGEVRVHRSTCSMLKGVNPEREIGVMWKAISKAHL